MIQDVLTMTFAISRDQTIIFELKNIGVEKDDPYAAKMDHLFEITQLKPKNDQSSEDGDDEDPPIYEYSLNHKSYTLLENCKHLGIFILRGHKLSKSTFITQVMLAFKSLRSPGQIVVQNPQVFDDVEFTDLDQDSNRHLSDTK